MVARVEEILRCYQEGSDDIQNAAQDLCGLYSGFSSADKSSMLNLLLERLTTKLLNPKECGSVDLIIRFFAMVEEIDRLLPVLFREIHWSDNVIRDIWAQTIYTELCNCIQNFPNAFSRISLDEIENHCQPLLHNRTKNLMAEMFSPSLIEGAATLELRTKKLRAEKC